MRVSSEKLKQLVYIEKGFFMDYESHSVKNISVCYKMFLEKMFSLQNVLLFFSLIFFFFFFFLCSNIASLSGKALYVHPVVLNIWS